MVILLQMIFAGNMFLNMITSQSHYELRVDVEDWNGAKGVAKYYVFKVGDISQKYSLVVGGFHYGNISKYTKLNESVHESGTEYFWQKIGDFL